MSSEQELNIVILGAGCSAAYGHPLAQNFRADLAQYGEQLAPRPGCDRLKQAVADTVTLMERHGSQTIDRLVRHLDEQADTASPGGILPAAHPLVRNWDGARARAEAQILDAKKVTMARFIELEAEARDRDLSGYRDLLGDIFGGSRKLSALASTKSRVLTFNYDRLFEKAFAEYFRLQPGQYVNCYQPELLNSGWRGWGGPGIEAEEIVQPRFCFLKLHGSALAWVDRFPGEARYIPCGLGQVVNDELLWPSGHQGSPIAPQPFIVFPHEKEGVIQSGYTPVYAPYLNKIWAKAGQLIQSAREIRVIGYSFDRNDRPFLMERLRRSPADCKIVIQGKDPASIIADLEPFHPDFEERFGDPVTRLF